MGPARVKTATDDVGIARAGSCPLLTHNGLQRVPDHARLRTLQPQRRRSRAAAFGPFLCFLEMRQRPMLNNSAILVSDF